jgi:hypothetical protein
MGAKLATFSASVNRQDAAYARAAAAEQSDATNALDRVWVSGGILERVMGIKST